MVDDRSHSEIDESFHVVNKRQEVRNSRQVGSRQALLRYWLFGYVARIVIRLAVVFFTSDDKRKPFPATQPFNDFI
jgi:hypothetical protein